jgi:hypothetical protein
VSTWLIEDIDTGLVDGFYSSFAMAADVKDYFQKEFPDSRFILREQINARRLHDCELITESDWFRSAKQL